MPGVTFWYEFASTYSYPAAMRIEELAGANGIELQWRPILLGTIFRDNGLPLDSPFNWQPAKGENMWRDLARICARDGLPMQRPDPFPQASLRAARVATVGLEAGWTPEFSRRLYLAEFGAGAAIHEAPVLGGILSDMGLKPDEILETANSEPVKSRLRAHTEAAKSAGVYGAPSVTTEDGELFWGNDRLEAAFDWANGIGRIAG